MLASIPSPSSGVISLGPLTIHMYGVMIALGVLAAVWLGQRRWEARGGDPDVISTLALICVPAGLIGTRIYHVITDWNRLYSDGRWWPQAFKIWDGGLGIPGGIAAGVLAGLWYARHRRLDIPRGLDVAAPAIPLAQAIGRWGNWWNQELFGRPTDLPWGLEIDPVKRGVRYADSPTFHPTFLYESLWNLGLVALLLWIDRRHRLRPGKLFPLYLGGYFLGRMWVEELRIDTAAEVLGLRWNFLLSIVMVAVSAVWFLAGGFRAPEGADLRPFETPESGGWLPGTYPGAWPADPSATDPPQGGSEGAEPAEVVSAVGGEVEEPLAEGRPGVDGPGSEGPV